MSCWQELELSEDDNDFAKQQEQAGHSQWEHVRRHYKLASICHICPCHPCPLQGRAAQDRDPSKDDPGVAAVATTALSWQCPEIVHAVLMLLRSCFQKCAIIQNREVKPTLAAKTISVSVSEGSCSTIV